jgi:hypothetical protein
MNTFLQPECFTSSSCTVHFPLPSPLPRTINPLYSPPKPSPTRQLITSLARRQGSLSPLFILSKHFLKRLLQLVDSCRHIIHYSQNWKTYRDSRRKEGTFAEDLFRMVGEFFLLVLLVLQGWREMVRDR